MGVVGLVWDGSNAHTVSHGVDFGGLLVDSFVNFCLHFSVALGKSANLAKAKEVGAAKGDADGSPNDSLDHVVDEVELSLIAVDFCKVVVVLRGALVKMHVFVVVFETVVSSRIAAPRPALNRRLAAFPASQAHVHGIEMSELSSWRARRINSVVSNWISFFLGKAHCKQRKNCFDHI